MSVKYVFVTGGVVSGLGKGITAASLGRLLKARGYLNCPASVIAPAFFLQHGPIYFSSGDIGIFS